MKVVIQRVQNASVAIEGAVVASIGAGLLILVGIEPADGHEDSKWLASKICNMRIFNDADGVMNNSLLAMNGELLAVSQFTLQASTKKGNRPSYINAAKPEIAIHMYEHFLGELESILNKKVEKGVFGADMKVALVNDGPVTILLDSKNKI